MKHYIIKEVLDLLSSYNLTLNKIEINSTDHFFKIYDNVMLIEKQTYYNRNLYLEINICTNKILTNTLGKIDKIRFDCFNNKNSILFETKEKHNHILAKPIDYYNILFQENFISSYLKNNSTTIYKSYKDYTNLNFYTPIEDINKTLNNLMFL